MVVGHGEEKHTDTVRLQLHAFIKVMLSSKEFIEMLPKQTVEARKR